MSSFCLILYSHFYVSGKLVMFLNLGEMALYWGRLMEPSNMPLSGHQSKLFQSYPLCVLHVPLCYGPVNYCGHACRWGWLPAQELWGFALALWFARPGDMQPLWACLCVGRVPGSNSLEGGFQNGSCQCQYPPNGCCLHSVLCESHLPLASPSG